MHVEFFLEEPSAEEALKVLLPKIFTGGTTFEIHQFGSKSGLIKRLPERLRGYCSWVGSDHKIVVLLDRDDDDCYELKKRLNEIAQQAGLTPKGTARKGGFQIVNRIAIEELESWFFGDIDALCSAYPRVPSTLHKRATFHDPDAIPGGTWEALERVLKAAGYHRGGLEKQRAAKDIAAHMDPSRNRSKSFQIFYRGIEELLDR